MGGSSGCPLDVTAAHRGNSWPAVDLGAKGKELWAVQTAEETGLKPCTESQHTVDRAEKAPCVICPSIRSVNSRLCPTSTADSGAHVTLGTGFPRGSTWLK